MLISVLFFLCISNKSFRNLLIYHCYITPAVHYSMLLCNLRNIHCTFLLHLPGLKSTFTSVLSEYYFSINRRNIYMLLYFVSLRCCCSCSCCYCNRYFCCLASYILWLDRVMIKYIEAITISCHFQKHCSPDSIDSRCVSSSIQFVVDLVNISRDRIESEMCP